MKIKSNNNQIKQVSNRLIIMLILLLVTVNVLIRYPTTPHEIGWDSWIMHSLAGAISDSGHAVWILHPLSYFGLYPMSEPSGVPFLISTVSQISKLSIEGTIYIYNVILGILAALGAFMLAGVLKKNFWFQYSAAFLFSTSMGLLLFTTWTLSTRGTLVVLTPLLIWLLIRASQHLDPGFVVATLLVLFTMSAVHRMFVLVIPFALLYIITNMIMKIKRLAKAKIKPSKQKKYRNIIAFIFLMGTLILFIFPLFGGFAEIYTVFSNKNDLDEMLIWGIGVFARNLGLLALLSLIGIVLLARKSGKDKLDFFILGSVVIISPMMFVGKYISTYSLIFFILLATYGLLLLHRMTKKSKVFYAFTSIILAVSFAMSGYGQISTFNILSTGSTIDARHMEIEGYDSAVWVKHNDIGVIAAGSQINLRIAAISGVPYFPGQGPTQLVYDFANPDEMVLETRSMFDIRYYTDSPIIDIEKIEEHITWDNYDINRKSVTDIKVKEYISRFNIDTLVINNYENTHSVFANSVMQTRYAIFNNQKTSMYFI